MVYGRSTAIKASSITHAAIITSNGAGFNGLLLHVLPRTWNRSYHKALYSFCRCFTCWLSFHPTEERELSVCSVRSSVVGAVELYLTQKHTETHEHQLSIIYIYIYIYIYICKYSSFTLPPCEAALLMDVVLRRRDESRLLWFTWRTDPDPRLWHRGSGFHYSVNTDVLHLHNTRSSSASSPSTAAPGIC